MTMNRMAIRTIRVKKPDFDYRFATGTTKKAPKEWEAMVGKDFIKFIERKGRK